MTTWPTITPRRWQTEAYPIALAAIESGKSGMIQAVMGAGKSVLISELAATTTLEFADVVVVTTSSRRLVRELAAELRKRSPSRKVGMFYSSKKEAGADFIVCCNPSAKKLGEELKARGKKVRLLIVDEAHRSECRTMLEAVNDHLHPRSRIGFTATPYRSLSSEELSMFEKLLYTYDARAALRDGVIVPYVVKPWMGRACSVDDACIEMIRKEEGPGVVNAVDTSDADAFAAILNEAGIPSAAIHYKVKDAEQTKRLDDLKTGKLKCVVHVSMLQEGVNLPWLRWLCLRRTSSSKIRFPQEVGRILRVDEGKDHAVVLDPNDLFGAFKLDYRAVLQGQADDDTRQAAMVMKITGCADGYWITEDIFPDKWGFEPGARIIARWGKNETRATIGSVTRTGIKLTDRDAYLVRSVPFEVQLLRSAAKEATDVIIDVLSKMSDVDAEALEYIEVYLRRLVMEFDAAGLVERKVASRDWRKEPITVKQVGAVKRAFGPVGEYVNKIPDTDRAALRSVCRATTSLKRGPASDLLGVLWGITSARGWPEMREGRE